MRKYNRFTSSTKDNGAGKDADKQLTVIIPAAGMGHRMKSYGPKCLLPVNQTNTIKQTHIQLTKDNNNVTSTTYSIVCMFRK